MSLFCDNTVSVYHFIIVVVYGCNLLAPYSSATINSVELIGMNLFLKQNTV